MNLPSGASPLLPPVNGYFCSTVISVLAQKVPGVELLAVDDSLCSISRKPAFLFAGKHIF